MIPCIGVTLAGETYYPLYNNSAMFRMREKYNDEAIKRVGENSEAGFALAFEIFRILCEEGEAVREHYGYEKGPLPDWEDAQLEYLPADVVSLKNAVYAAISLGCDREVPNLEEVDLTLVELQKKKRTEAEAG